MKKIFVFVLVTYSAVTAAQVETADSKSQLAISTAGKADGRITENKIGKDGGRTSFA